jgi:hypothetical protein
MVYTEMLQVYAAAGGKAAHAGVLVPTVDVA